MPTQGTPAHDLYIDRCTCLPKGPPHDIYFDRCTTVPYCDFICCLYDKIYKEQTIGFLWVGVEGEKEKTTNLCVNPLLKKYIISASTSKSNFLHQQIVVSNGPKFKKKRGIYILVCTLKTIKPSPHKCNGLPLSTKKSRLSSDHHVP